MELVILTSLKNALLLSIKLIVLIIFIMVAYELFENSKLYNLVQESLNSPLKKLGVTPASSITMIVGLILGIVYGAGILIQNAMKKNMSPKDIFLSSIFLSICHAIIEDTLIYVAVGANGLVILGTRIFLALIVVFSLQKILFN